MKKEFRKKVIESRKNKSANFVLSNSNLITEKLLQMEDIRNATNIMLYLNFNNEVQTDNLIKKTFVSKENSIKSHHNKRKSYINPYSNNRFKRGIENWSIWNKRT